MRTIAVVFFCCFALPLFAQHPVAFATKAELESVKRDIARYPLLQKSFNEIRKDVDGWLGKELDVPFPKDPAGGYTHDRHKANYTVLFNSGLLYNLTGDVRYATLVKNTLLKYAQLNPTLGKHPQATRSSPGRLFWQALNDANWLVYSGMAYDLIYNTLSAAERRQIEDGAFKREVEFLTKDLKKWFKLSTITAEQTMKDRFAREYARHYSQYTAPALSLAQLQGYVAKEKLLLPIPQREIDTNTQLAIPQNPGY